MSEEGRKLKSFDIDGVVDYIKSGRAKKIILMTGAGISTAAGIPDFRSIGTGLYSNLQKYNLPEPSDVFNIKYFKENQEPFYDLCPSLLPGGYKPTFIHYFAAYLAKKGILLKQYTQNIDGLERIAGVPTEKLVESHGTFYSAHCTACKKEWKLDEIRGELMKGKPLHCTVSGCEGFIKPDIVFFGENLPEAFQHNARIDLRSCDMVIIIGTSLKVNPFASLAGSAPDDVPRVLINLDKVAQYTEEEMDMGGEIVKIKPQNWRSLLRYDHPSNTRDVYLGGDCQETVKNLAKKLGWYDEIVAMMK